MNKSLKKLFSLALALALVFSSGLGVGTLDVQAAEANTFTDVKADHEFYDYVTYLAEKDITTGYTTGEKAGTFGVNETLTRNNAAVFLIRALGTELGTYKGTFADVKQGTSGALHIEAAAELGLVKGYTKDGVTEFRPQATVTRGQFAKMVALAYELKADVNKTLTMTDLAGNTEVAYIKAVIDHEVVNGYPDNTYRPSNGVTRGHVSKFIYNAEHLVPEVEELKVTSVKALNATQVEVGFSQEVAGADAAGASNLIKYAIGSANPSTVVLQPDGKTVLLTFDTQAKVEVAEEVFVVEPVQSKFDPLVKSPRYTQIFTYKDVVKPEIASIVSQTNTNTAASLTVYFSEPVASTTAKLNGVYRAIVLDSTGTMGTMSGLTLAVNENHTLELINLTDKAGTANVNVITSKVFNVTKDATAPTVTLSQSNDKEILLTFDKAMDLSSVTTTLAAGTDVVKDEAFAGVNTGIAKHVVGSGNKQFTIAITPDLYDNTTSRTLTVVLPNTIKDALGNKLVTTTKQITLTQDLVKPEAIGYKIVKNASGNVTHLEINFSEALLNGGAVANPTIVNSNGQIVTTTVASTSFLGGVTGAAVSKGDKKISYAFKTPAKISGVYNFSFAANLVTDISENGNKSASFNYNVDFGQSAVGTFDVTSASGSSNVITVTYPVAVRGGAVANSATDLANYTLGGKPLPVGTTITLDGDQKVATITLAPNSIDKTDTTATFTVNNVKALNGDTSKSFLNTVAIVDNVAPVLKAATLNADNTITLEFTETVTGLVKDDLVLKVNGKVMTLPSGATLQAGTGSDTGKWVLDTKAIAYETATTSTYVTMDGNVATYSAATDILIDAATDVTTTFKFKTSPLITSMTVGTAASGIKGADAEGNNVKTNTTITVK